jgi:hypothetical protein
MPILDKTSMCKFYQQRKCKKGKDCTFAHAEEDLRERPDLSGTKICPSVGSGNACMNPTCRFAHVRDDIRRLKVNHQSGKVYSKDAPQKRPNDWMQDLNKLPVYTNTIPGFGDACAWNLWRTYGTPPAMMAPNPYMSAMPGMPAMPAMPGMPMPSPEMMMGMPGMTTGFQRMGSDGSDGGSVRANSKKSSRVVAPGLSDGGSVREKKSQGGGDNSPKRIQISTDMKEVTEPKSEKRMFSKKSHLKMMKTITEDSFDYREEDDMGAMTTGISDGCELISPTSTVATERSLAYGYGLSSTFSARESQENRAAKELAALNAK